MSIASVIACFGIGTVAVVLARSRERAVAAREAAGQCSYCPTEVLPDTGYRVEGRLVCPRCASRLRRRVVGAFGALAGLIVVAVGLTLWFTVDDLRSGSSDWWVELRDVGGVAVGLTSIGVFAFRSMREANRAAGKIAAVRELEQIQGGASAIDGPTSAEPDA